MATVVGILGRTVMECRRSFLDLDHGNLPDPVEEGIRRVLKGQEELRERMNRLEKFLGDNGPVVFEEILGEHEERLGRLRARAAG